MLNRLNYLLSLLICFTLLLTCLEDNSITKLVIIKNKITLLYKYQPFLLSIYQTKIKKNYH